MSLDVYLRRKKSEEAILSQNLLRERLAVILKELDDLDENYHDLTYDWADFQDARSTLRLATSDWAEVNQSSETIYSSNITHNLGTMAGAVSENFYKALWRPYELFGLNEDEWEMTPVYAVQIIPIVEKGLVELRAHRERYEFYNAPNGWGTYDHFLPFVQNYLGALKANEGAIVITSR